MDWDRLTLIGTGYARALHAHGGSGLITIAYYLTWQTVVAGPFFVIRKQLPTKTNCLFAFGLLAAFGLLPWLFIQAACAGCHLLRMVPMAIGL